MLDFSPADPESMIQTTQSEQAFERWQRAVGLTLGLVAFLGVWFWPFATLSSQAHALAAVLSAVIILWMTEAIPMPVTALIGASACIILQIGTAQEVFASFADPLIFVFIGSFILAQGIFQHQLDRRVAFGVLSLPWIGGNPARILFGFGVVTLLLSGWISNTATTAMMFAIGMGILRFLFAAEKEGNFKINRNYATAMMLMTSFAASIGGLATPVGSPPNLIGLNAIKQHLDIEINFLKWSMMGYPLVFVLFGFMYLYFRWLCPAGITELPGVSKMLQREKAELGRWTRGQYATLFAFGVTLVLWFVPGVIGAIAEMDKERFATLVSFHKSLKACVPESVAALVGASLLFLLPGKPGRRALSWREASDIDWGVVLLYGGGVSLGNLAQTTGLSEAAGQALADLELAGLLPFSPEFTLVLVAAVTATLVSETMSNTASALVFVPIVITLARSMGIDPLQPALAATFCASLGFMLPVSTPCNAIVYGSGLIPLPRMIRYGLLLDVLGIVVVVLMVTQLVPLLITT